jgi:hypothetical protein
MTSPKVTRPIVNIATVCEKVMVEKDNVVSLIRVVDTFFVPEEALAQAQNSFIPVTGLIVLRGGDFVGEGELSLAVESPDGKKTDVPDKFPMTFSCSDHSNNVVCNMAISLRHIGTSWVTVLWNGDLLTKFPIKLAQQTKPEMSAAKS